MIFIQLKIYRKQTKKGKKSLILIIINIYPKTIILNVNFYKKNALVFVHIFVYIIM